MSRYPHIEALLFDQPWAITPRALDSMIARVEGTKKVDLEAVAAALGRPLEHTENAEQRGATAILDINGPIFRRAGLFARISGATSVDTLARDFHEAAINASVENIMLRINSAGGEVNGIADLAEMFHKSPKPVYAFVDGLGASAAYWLASAAQKVYGSADSFTGSIGIVASLTDRRAAQEKKGVKTYQIVSSQSPRKMADPSTEDGHAQILEMVDSLGQLFVDRVAAYRGVDAAKVLAEFGKGGVLPAHLAQRAGMIDGITSEEELIASLQPKARTTVAVPLAAQEETMDPTQAGTTTQPVPAPTAAAAPATDAAAEERRRIQAILALPEAQGREALARALAFEPGLDIEAARRILGAAPAATAAAENGFEREMARIKNPKVGAGSDAADPDLAEAQRILALVPSNRRIPFAQPKGEN